MIEAIYASLYAFTFYTTSGVKCWNITMGMGGKCRQIKRWSKGFSVISAMMFQIIAKNDVHRWHLYDNKYIFQIKVTRHERLYITIWLVSWVRICYCLLYKNYIWSHSHSRLPITSLTAAHSFQKYARSKPIQRETTAATGRLIYGSEPGQDSLSLINIYSINARFAPTFGQTEAIRNMYTAPRTVKSIKNNLCICCYEYYS